MRLFIVPCPAAGTRPGNACASAPRHTSAIRCETSTLPAPTAAGGRAFTIVPAGAITRTGRIAPPLAGNVGSQAERKANETQLTVTASTALTLPGRCSDEPVKSNVTVPSAAERVSFTTIGAGTCCDGAGPVESITSANDHEPSGIVDN